MTKQYIFLTYFLLSLTLINLTCANKDEDEFVGNGKIVYGQEAQSGQFPWMAGVHGQRDDGSWEHWRCGGALISRNLVLSAEHCADQQLRNYRITLGSTLAGDDQDGDGKLIRYADLIIKHGDGLIFRLSEDVVFTDKIQPVDLPSKDDYVGEGVDVTVSGWGGTGEGDNSPLSNKLLFTTSSTITTENCNKYYGPIKPDVLCFLNERSTTCGGDSGSPVVRYENGRAIHVAILNAGVPGCWVNYPSLATRTASHMEWIQTELNNHSS